MEERGVGLYQSWNEDLRSRYIPLLDDIVKVLRKRPSMPFTITEIDKRQLLEALVAMDVAEEPVWDILIRLGVVEKEGELPDLDDPEIFAIVKGIVRGLAIKKIEKGALKPGNPLEAELAKIEEESPDLELEEE